MQSITCNHITLVRAVNIVKDRCGSKQSPIEAFALPGGGLVKKLDSEPESEFLQRVADIAKNISENAKPVIVVNGFTRWSLDDRDHTIRCCEEVEKVKKGLPLDMNGIRAEAVRQIIAMWERIHG